MDEVSGSIRDFLEISTSKPKCPRKSAPIIGLATSAMINFQLNSRCKFKFRVNRRRPYVLMEEELIAESFSQEGESLVLGGLGTTETSAPVSMRNFNLVVGSKIERRLMLLAPWLAVKSEGVISFLKIPFY